MVDKLERRPVLLTTPSTCRMPKFLSPKFGTKFQREVPLFWSYLNFSILLIMGVRTGLNSYGGPRIFLLSSRVECGLLLPMFRGLCVSVCEACKKRLNRSRCLSGHGTRVGPRNYAFGGARVPQAKSNFFRGRPLR